MSPDVTIIGAGISGLAAAYALQERGRNVLVLERQARTGGKATSEHIGGFLMEHGPSSINGTSPAAAAWSGALGLEDEQVELGPGVKRRYLTAGGRLCGIPTHPLGFLTSGYLTLPGRLRMLGEIAIPRGERPPGETVAQFCTRRFGAEFAERVMEPLVAGMFADDARLVGAASVFPALVEMEKRHGSIIRALIRARAGGGRMPGRRLFSWRDGIGTLPQALAARLAPWVRTGIAVRRIAVTAGGFRIEAGANGAIETSAVVIATPPHVAAGLLADIDAAAAEAAAAIEAPPLAVAFLGYRRDQVAHPLDGIGYLTPAGERRALTGALFASTMFPGRAPEGHVALSAYLGGARAPELALRPPRELLGTAEREFAELLEAKGRPVVARLKVWPRGLPQYHAGHAARIAALEHLSDRVHGLLVTGNYLHGVSIAACLQQAIDTADRVNALLLGGNTRTPVMSVSYNSSAMHHGIARGT